MAVAEQYGVIQGFDETVLVGPAMHDCITEVHENGVVSDGGIHDALNPYIAVCGNNIGN